MSILTTYTHLISFVSHDYVPTPTINSKTDPAHVSFLVTHPTNMHTIALTQHY